MSVARRESRSVFAKTLPRPKTRLSGETVGSGAAPVVIGSSSGWRFGLRPVLGEECLLEGGFTAHEVEQLVAGRGLHDRGDGPATRMRRTPSSAPHIAHAGKVRELLPGSRAGEAQLHLVVGHVAQGVHAVDSRQPAVPDDRHPVAGPLHLRQHVARHEDRAPLVLRLAHEREEGLLDERVEPRRRLVEDEELRPMLERHHEPDLLLVALRVLLELPRRVEVEPRDEIGLVGGVDAAAQVGEVLDRLAPGELVVQHELARQVAEPAMDRDRVDGRLDAEHRARPLVGRRWSSSVRIVVVLPAPLGPRKPKASPSRTTRSTSMMPRCSPYALVRRSVSMTGVVPAPAWLLVMRSFPWCRPGTRRGPPRSGRAAPAILVRRRGRSRGARAGRAPAAPAGRRRGRDLVR